MKYINKKQAIALFRLLTIAGFVFCVASNNVFGQPTTITANGQTVILPTIENLMSAFSTTSAFGSADIAVKNLAQERSAEVLKGKEIVNQINKWNTSAEFIDFTKAFAPVSALQTTSAGVFKVLTEDYATLNKEIKIHNAKTCTERKAGECQWFVDEGNALESRGEALDVRQENWEAKDDIIRKRFLAEVLPKWKIAKEKYDAYQARLKAVQDRLNKLKEQLTSVKLYRDRCLERLEKEYKQSTIHLRRGAFMILEVDPAVVELNTEIEALKAGSDVDFDGRRKP